MLRRGSRMICAVYSVYCDGRGPMVGHIGHNRSPLKSSLFRLPGQIDVSVIFMVCVV